MNEETNEKIRASLAANVLRLGNECRDLAAENARLKAEVELWKLRSDNWQKFCELTRPEMTDELTRLKAEVERLSQPAIIGGYNLSQYIRMANSETLEFDNGDIFAEMTLPERIKYIVESHARLRSVAEDNKTECEATRIENARLKAECQARQAENSVLAVECDSLKAEVERLTSDLQMEKENEDRLVREWQKANNEVYGLNTQVAALIDDQTRLKAEVERLKRLLPSEDDTNRGGFNP